MHPICIHLYLLYHSLSAIWYLQSLSSYSYCFRSFHLEYLSTYCLFLSWDDWFIHVFLCWFCMFCHVPAGASEATRSMGVSRGCKGACHTQWQKKQGCTCIWWIPIWINKLKDDDMMMMMMMMMMIMKAIFLAKWRFEVKIPTKHSIRPHRV